MSETAAAQPAQAEQQTATPATPEPQQETDWKAEARKWEDRAKSNSAAARRLAEFEEAQKTAEEKAQEREAAAEKRAADAEARALRREIALDHKLSTADAALLDAVVGEDAMRNLAKRLAGQAEDSKKQLHVPSEGANPAAPDTGERAFLRGLTGRN